MESFQIHSIPGITAYGEVYALQKEFLEKRIRDEVVDTFILCEHHPVITRGRGLQRFLGEEKTDQVKERSKPLLFIPDGTEYHEIERGGDLTWHGPGQLVMYPILKLGGEGYFGKNIGQDVDKYIRFLESFWIQFLKGYGILGLQKPGGSGVWVGDKKIASVGIALRRWVTYHGIAINFTSNLDQFKGFDPCGFEASVMTSLEQCLGKDFAFDRTYLEEKIGTQLKSWIF